jgi:hypothetical protein
LYRRAVRQCRGNFTAQPGVDEKLIRELASLRFLDDAGNVVFVGPPGTGKMMLAMAGPCGRPTPTPTPHDSK